MDRIKAAVKAVVDAYEQQPKLLQEAEVAAGSAGFYYVVGFVAQAQPDPHVAIAVFAVGLARAILTALKAFVPKPA